MNDIGKDLQDAFMDGYRYRDCEIVRCKECVHKFVDRTNNVSFNYCELNHNKVQPDDWYCADGERRCE